MSQGLLHIILLEDNPDDAELIVRALRNGGIQLEEEIIDNRSDFQEALQESTFDLVISDHKLQGDFNSIEALKLLQEHKIDRPFILVSGAISAETATRIMKQGADDYVLKDRLNRLPEAVKKVREHYNTRQAKDRAENELFTFISRIIHDLRGPIANIEHLSKLSIEDTPDGLSRENFEMINHSSRQVREKLNALLQRVKIRQKRREIKEIDFAQLVESVAQWCEIDQHHADINFQTDIQVSNPFFSDSNLIDLILRNLVENAIKYCSPDRSPFIRITAADIKQGVRLKVIDNGTGIPEKDHSKVFNVFYRADSRTEGTGIGLYLVKQAVRKLDGHLSLDSKTGQGTTFTIDFPTLQSTEPEGVK